MTRFQSFIAVIATAALAPVASLAATFQGEFWDARVSLNNFSQAQAIIAAGPATAKFRSSAIDYPNGSTRSITDNTTLSAFLGADAATLTGAGTTNMYRSVFRFTGSLLLAPGQQTFGVGSDDGFNLIIGGTRIGGSGNRGFSYSNMVADAGEGVADFELIFWENGGSTGIEFKIDNALAAAPVSPVPLPAGLPLALLGLGALGFVARKRHANA